VLRFHISYSRTTSDWLCPKSERNGTEKILTQKCTNPTLGVVRGLHFPARHTIWNSGSLVQDNCENLGPL